MMVALGIYTLCMLIVWIVYIIARAHNYRFQEYSGAVRPITRFLGIVLIVFTLLGYYFLIQAVSMPKNTVSSVGSGNSQPVSSPTY